MAGGNGARHTGPMETFLTLGLTAFVIVGAILGIAAAVAMVKAPYRK
jgi:hypothetical protein